MDPAAAAAIGVIGTLSGVGVNELFASKRTSKMIGAQERQLDKQLVHDRGLRDLEELREVLDAAAAAATRVNDNCITWVNHLATLDPDDSADVEEAFRLQQGVYEEIFGLSQYRLRIDLRLMIDSEASIAFGRVRDAWADIFQAIVPSRPISNSERKQFSDRMGEAAEEYGQFFVAAHRLVKSRPVIDAGAETVLPLEEH